MHLISIYANEVLYLVVLRDWGTIQSLANRGNEFGIYLRLNWRWQAGLCQAHRKSNSGNRSCPPDDSFITHWCWLMSWNFSMLSMALTVIIMQFSRYISENSLVDNAISLSVNMCNIRQPGLVFWYTAISPQRIINSVSLLN